MNETTALERLTRLVNATSEPVLDSADLAHLLDLCRLPDASGLSPSDTDWEPTWDLNRGAAAGWLLKASRAATVGYDVQADGQSMALSQRVEQFERVAATYRRRITYSIPTPGSRTSDTLTE